ncbi:MAG: hypothetical protein HY735_36210 [Verrucomicrobia bacterium]|nr:hypothetical protein [Verrucomicrobiota bacterium]
MKADTLERLWVALQDTLTSKERPAIVAIGGAECSGKTYLAEALSQHARLTKTSLLILPMDSYLRFSRHERRLIARGRRGIEASAIEIGDHPDCFDFDQLREDALSLVHSAQLPKTRHYDYVHGVVTVSEQPVRIQAQTIVALDGILALHDKLLLLPKIKIFVTAEPRVLMERYIQRHLRRGVDTEATIRDRFCRVVMPVHKMFIEPTKLHADVRLDTSQGRLDFS